MIQILGYREYFNKNKQIWDVKHVLMDVSAESIPDLFLNSEKYLEKIPKDERFNLHYTIADCFEAPRLFKTQATIPFDLDDIDTEKIADYISIMTRELKVPFNEIGITFSGHGLHFLIETNYSIQSEEELKSLQGSYKSLCGRIEGAMKSAGLPGKVDSAIFRPSGTLRFPGSENRAFYKRDEKLPHKLFPSVMSYAINTTIIPQDFKILDISPTETTSKENVSPKELRQFPRPDTEFLLKECQFLKWNFEKPHEVVEPQWYAALSIVGALPNGRDIAHQMSKGHPSYDYSQTDIKLEQAMAASGPRTCSNIDTLSDKCRSCKYFGQVTSPILLRGPDYIKTLDTGFWILDKKLNPKAPAYDDLAKFFDKKHKYISGPGERIYIWTGSYWKEKEKRYITSFIEEHMNPKPNSNQRMEFLSKIRNTNLVDKDTDAFFTETIIGKCNLKNGVYDFESGTFFNHSQEFGFRSCMDHEYDPKATCPTWDQFLKDITCDRKELADILEEYMAYALSGMPYIYHKVLMLTGEGSNGKSTFLNILKKLAGRGAYTSTMLNRLADQGELAKMDGKLFNISGETPRGSFKDTSAFKGLSSGDGFTAKKLYQDPYDVESNRTKLIMACNDLPDINDFSGGFERRLLIIPFDAHFSDKRLNKVGPIADAKMEERLAKELPGIFNRILVAYDRLMTQKGFTPSEFSEIAAKEYSAAHNTISTFFDEELEYDRTKDWHILPTPLYTIYSEWCKKIGIRNASYQTFNREISRITGEKTISKKINGAVIKVREHIRPRITPQGIHKDF